MFDFEYVRDVQRAGTFTAPIDCFKVGNAVIHSTEICCACKSGLRRDTGPSKEESEECRLKIAQLRKEG